MSQLTHQVFAGVAAVLVGVAVVWGFALVGSPATSHLRKLDERRIYDMKTIQREILNIVFEGVPWSQRAEGEGRPLPRTLQEIAQQARDRRVSLRDPATDAPYEYRVVDEKHFELCATFELPRDRSEDVGWNHPAGRHCFFFDVRTQDVPTNRRQSEPTKE